MAASLNIRGVHQYDKVPGQPGVFRLARITPYIRLSSNGQTLFIQHGTVFSEENGPIKKQDIPAWFTEELKKVSPQALAEVGWKQA